MINLNDFPNSKGILFALVMEAFLVCLLRKTTRKEFDVPDDLIFEIHRVRS